MRQVDNPSGGLLLQGFISVLCAIWLGVFLGPMEKLNLLVGAGTFSTIFIILVVAQMFPYRLLRFLAGFAASIGYVAHYYTTSGLTFFAGLRELLHIEFQQMQAALQGDGLSDPLQTQLFLWGLCLMYWLIVYASRRTRLWMFYNILAVIVLGIIDGNTPVHPDTAIVAVLLICVIVLGMLHFSRLKENLVSSSEGTARFFGPFAGLIAFTLVVGWAMPKQDAVWPDPILWAKQLGSGKGNGSVQQVIGYQSDNSHLGGSFVMNHDPVLSVVTKVPSYLRGQVYDVYTGQGWMTNYDSTFPVVVGHSFPSETNPIEQIPTKPVTQLVTVLSPQLNVPVIFGTYQVTEVQSASFSNSAGSGSIPVDRRTGTVLGPPLAVQQHYQVVSNEMQDPTTVLSSLPALPANRASAYPDDVRTVDLQLTPNLPPRVRQLAKDLTKTAKNEYEAVTDIRDYLQATYPYETQNIPVPALNQDYVDQFLFDSKKGYCNNFSSSMAVMLRTLDIPARWVTGFATGTVDGTYSGPDMRYIYENSDAHSWVEVYFPTVGWVPFDPTPNFTMPYLNNPNSGSTSPSNGGSGSKTTKPTKPDSTDTSAASSSNATGSIPWATILHDLEWGLGILAVLAIVLGYVFRKRIRETRHRWVWKGNSPNALLRALQHLVKTLRKYGDIPHKPRTLRDLHSVAKSYGIADDEYAHMIQTAESNWYGGVTPSEEDLHKVKGTWVRWILEILRR